MTGIPKRQTSAIVQLEVDEGNLISKSLLTCHQNTPTVSLQTHAKAMATKQIQNRLQTSPSCIYDKCMTKKNSATACDEMTTYCFQYLVQQEQSRGDQVFAVETLKIQNKFHWYVTPELKLL